MEIVYFVILVLCLIFGVASAKQEGEVTFGGLVLWIMFSVFPFVNFVFLGVLIMVYSDVVIWKSSKTEK